MKDDTEEYPCPNQPSVPCKWSRNAIRDISTNSAWVTLGKYSAGLVLVGSLVSYIYSQGNTYTDEKLSILIAQGTKQQDVNERLIVALSEFKYLKRDIADVKKNIDQFKMEVRQKFLTLEKDK